MQVPLVLLARRSWPAVAVLTGVLVLASAAFKARCVDSSRNFRETCYSDVLELFTSRDLARHYLPYVDGRLEGGAPVDTFEYPVLTGLFASFSALFADDRTSFLVASTVLLLPFAVVVSVLLQRLAGERALLWAASPPLVLYALHNWDLLAVAAAVGALYAWQRERPLVAALLLGLGANLKIYPGLFLAPLLADRLLQRDRRGAAGVVAVGGLAVALPNVPFVLADLDGWLATFAFQEQRAADATSNSVWFWFAPQLTTETLNRLTPVLVLLAVAVAVAVGAWRSRREGAFPMVQVCGAVLVAFLLVNKVHSPQYTLWVLPFFALLAVRLGWWVAYVVADALVYVGVFRWLFALTEGRDFGLAKQALIVGVWSKTALLILLYAVFLAARTARPVGGTEPAQPTQRPEVNVSTSTAMSGADTAR